MKQTAEQVPRWSREPVKAKAVNEILRYMLCYISHVHDEATSKISYHEKEATIRGDTMKLCTTSSPELPGIPFASIRPCHRCR
jgi:hypothetical protein